MKGLKHALQSRVSCPEVRELLVLFEGRRTTWPKASTILSAYKRIELVQDYVDRPDLTIAELAAKHQVPRATAYRWIASRKAA